MEANRSPLEVFLREYVEIAGGVWEEVEPQVYDVFLPEATPQDQGRVLRVAFAPEALPEHPGSQLLIYGSPLLDRLFAQAWQQGRISRAYLLGLNLASRQALQGVASDLRLPTRARWETRQVRPLFFSHAAFWFQATFHSDEKEQENYLNVVDLYYGRFARHLEELLRGGESPYSFAQERPFPWPDAPRLGLAAAYQRGRDRVVGTAASVAHTHRLEHEQRLGRQVERMQHYYRDLRDELQERLERARQDRRTTPETRRSLEERIPGLAQEEHFRLAELRQRSHLRLHLRLCNLMLLAYPKFFLQGRLVPAKGPAVEMALVWDPLAGHLEPPPCPCCQRPTRVLAQGRQGTLGCPECGGEEGG